MRLKLFIYLIYMTGMVTVGCSTTERSIAPRANSLAERADILASVADRQFIAGEYRKAEENYEKAGHILGELRPFWELGAEASRFAQNIEQYIAPVGHSEIGDFIASYMERVEELQRGVPPERFVFVRARACRIANRSLRSYRMGPECDEESLRDLVSQLEEAADADADWEGRAIQEMALALAELGRRQAAYDLIRSRSRPSEGEKQILAGLLQKEMLELQSRHPQVASIQKITRSDTAFVLHREFEFASSQESADIAKKTNPAVQTHPFSESFAWMENLGLTFIRNSENEEPERIVERREVAMLLDDLMALLARKNRILAPVGRGADRQRKFFDLPNEAPSYPALLKLTLMGGIKAKNGKIGPYDPVSGKELLAMVHVVKLALQ